MPMPSTHDTIVAVSSGWLPEPVGIIRLSGPESFGLVDSVGVRPTCPAAAARPLWTLGRLRLEGGQALPVTAVWFRAPRSYTGQDVVELHTVGCLPLVRELAARLIELGARRALPGEFTARAFVNGRLTAAQVEGVLALMQAEHEAAVRQAARLARGLDRRVAEDVAEGILRLLAVVEAGIDFVEEDDVRLITAPEVVRELDALLAGLAAAGRPEAADLRVGRPHVALVGLPNAGKSTLFNALVGYERALVSPVLGTTRDVLSAEADFGGVAVILQDCAGVGGSTDELELACHLASERAAQEADLVLWVHAADTAWDPRETVACAGIAPQRRLLVWTKADLTRARPASQAPVTFAEAAEVSATAGIGIRQLRELLVRHLGKLAALRGEASCGGEFRAAAAALRRARAMAVGSDDDLPSPELISLELRAAHGLLPAETHGTIDEQLLDRIFAAFCVGK
jgi:tRNA modification GTPase